MPVEKNLSVSPAPQSLFQDRYRVLALAAHAALTKTPRALKVRNYLGLRLMQWANNALVIVKRLGRSSAISLSDFILFEEGSLMRQIVWEERVQSTKRDKAL